jgi:hypothetical protein
VPSIRGQADCQDLNINDFVTAVQVNGKQVFPVEFAELGADEFSDVGGIVDFVVVVRGTDILQKLDFDNGMVQVR